MKRLGFIVVALLLAACSKELPNHENGVSIDNSTLKKIVTKVSESVDSVWTHEFSVGDFGVYSNGTTYSSLTNPANLSGASWTISDPGVVFNSNNGIWVGNYVAQISEFSLSTSSFQDKTITNVALVYSADEVSVAMTCTVGGVEFQSDINEQTSTIEFTGTGSGTIVITVTPTSAGGGVFFYNLSIDCTDGTYEPELPEVDPNDPVSVLTSYVWRLDRVDNADDWGNYNDITSAIGNTIEFNTDYTVDMDFSANNGSTYDHTDSGDWIANPAALVYNSGTRWSFSNVGDTNYINMTNGSMVVNVQVVPTNGQYEILALDTTNLKVITTTDWGSYSCTWTLWFTAVGAASPDPEPEPPYNPVEHGYEIVWQDEFTVNDFSQYWFENWGGGGNGEVQYYCANGVHTDGTRTAEISNGTLKITAHKVRRFNIQGTKYNYISARLNTYDCWQYGYIEMKAKMPTVAGCWPAFWMLPDYDVYPAYVRETNQGGAGAGGEIDIVEYIPNDGNISYFSAHSYNVTAEAGNDTVYSNGGSYCQSTYLNNPDEWHTYGMLWTEDKIIGYLDGQPYFYAIDGTGLNTAVNPNWGFDKPYYIKLNLALGGGWGGTIDPNFTSATFEIDYIRVYQK